MVYNAHLLTHLINTVKNCGPLFCYSNFNFEDHNGVLTRYINGTREVQKQVRYGGYTCVLLGVLELKFTFKPAYLAKSTTIFAAYCSRF